MRQTLAASAGLPAQALGSCAAVGACAQTPAGALDDNMLVLCGKDLNARLLRVTNVAPPVCPASMRSSGAAHRVVLKRLPPGPQEEAGAGPCSEDREYGDVSAAVDRRAATAALRSAADIVNATVQRLQEVLERFPLRSFHAWVHEQMYECAFPSHALARTSPVAASFHTEGALGSPSLLPI